LLSLDSKDEEDMLSDVKRASCNQDHSSVERNEKRRPAWDHDCWWGHRHILFGKKRDSCSASYILHNSPSSILGGLAFKGSAFVFEICRFLENAYFLQWKSDSSKSRCNNIRNVINV